MGLLLPEAQLDAIVFACTSGSAIIGPAKIAGQIAALRPGVPVINPATAAVEALKYLGCSKIAFIAPYTEDVAEITSGYSLRPVSVFPIVCALA